MTRSELIEATTRICARLQGPLAAEELASGWSDENRAGTLQYFERLLADLRSGTDIPFFSLIRALDACGISDGELLEEACRINNAVNRLSGRL